MPAPATYAAAFAISGCVAIVPGLLSWMQGLPVPIALAIFLAFLLSPPVTLLERRGVPRALALLLTLFMLLRRDDLLDRLVTMFGRTRLVATTRMLDEAGVRISRYLLAQLMVNASFGAVLAAGPRAHRRAVRAAVELPVGSATSRMSGRCGPAWSRSR